MLADSEFPGGKQEEGEKYPTNCWTRINKTEPVVRKWHAYKEFMKLKHVYHIFQLLLPSLLTATFNFQDAQTQNSVKKIRWGKSKTEEYPFSKANKQLNRKTEGKSLMRFVVFEKKRNSKTLSKRKTPRISLYLTSCHKRLKYREFIDSDSNSIHACLW